MVINPDEESPYLTHVPAGVLPTQSEVSTEDEASFDTLKVVQKELHTAVDELSSGYNAFDLSRISENVTLQAAQEKLYFETAVRQAVYDILSPLVETIDNAITGVDNQHKS